MTLDLQSELDQVYLLPPGQFVSARNQLEKRLKAAGQTAEAKTVKALAKPKLTAWLINWIALAQVEGLAALRAAGQELAEAQAGGDGAALLAASEQRKQAVKRCLELARQACDAHGEKLTAASERELATSLETLAAQPDDAGAPNRPGRMTQPLGAAGFDAFGLAGVTLIPSTTTSAPLPQEKRGKRSKSAAPKPPELSAEERRAAERSALQKRLDEARGLLETLGQRLSAARQQLQASETRRTETLAQLQRAETDYRAALDEAERRKADLARKKRELERADETLQGQTKGVRQLVEQQGSAQQVVAELERSVEQH
ncbi:MAG: hypothetical protein KC766_40900 [Myxococcales bacterium]|nr:hypothetical protein [Myxococcales bacterium]